MAGKLVAPKDVGDVAGVYSCTGKEGDKPYWGVVVIQQAGEGIYHVRWLVGRATMEGIGIRIGDTLSVGWTMTTAKGLVQGVTQYRVLPGPALDGRWATIPGSGEIVRESLRWLGALPKVDE